MNFEDIYIRVISEKYYTYSMPEDKSKMMYDFYVLNYLNDILGFPSPSHRDLRKDLEDSVKDAVNTLFPLLKQELLDAVFYSICAEIRHAEVYETSNIEAIKDNPKFLEMYKKYKKYKIFHKKTQDSQEELTDIFGVEKPSSTIRPPESEKVPDQRERNISYKAANYALEKTGYGRQDFVEMCEKMYRDGSWSTSYGGKAWADICDGWLMLWKANKIDATSAVDKSEKLQSEIEKSVEDLISKDKDKDPDKKSKSTYNYKPTVEKKIPEKTMGVAIDHIYDLQHNTSTVFNKLNSYLKDGKYTWILKALDHKANVETYHELLNQCSGTVKAMAIPVLYNKLGSTWEKEILRERPKTSITPEVGDKFRGKPSEDLPSDIYQVIYVRNNIAFKSVDGDKKKQIRMSTDEFIKKIMDGSFKYTNKTVTIPTSEPEQTTVTAPPSTEFKKGDTIECVDNSSCLDKLTVGKTYKVIEAYGGPYPQVKIQNDKGKTFVYHVGRFKLAQPEQTTVTVPDNPHLDQQQTQFEKGDIIKCIDTGSYVDELTIGKTYEVIEAYGYEGSHPQVRIQNDKGNKFGYYVSRFQLVSKASTPENTSESKFKKGDIVELIDSKTYMTKGKTYEVLGVDTNTEKGVTYLIIINDEGIKVKIYDWRFKKVGESTPDDISENDKIKIGDDVEYMENSFPTELTKGKIYKVIDVIDSHFHNNYSMITVENDIGNKQNYYMSRFKKVNQDHKPTKPQEEIKAGDDVEFIYKVLKVKKLSNNTLITVKTDSGFEESYYDWRFKKVDSPTDKPTSENVFKPGDKLLCVNDDDTTAVTKGKIYTVCNPPNRYVDIQQFVFVICDNGICGGMDKKRFVLAPKEEQPKPRVKNDKRGKYTIDQLIGNRVMAEKDHIIQVGDAMIYKYKREISIAIIKSISNTTYAYDIYKEDETSSLYYLHSKNFLFYKLGIDQEVKSGTWTVYTNDIKI
jgi:hypothetical protein